METKDLQPKSDSASAITEVKLDDPANQNPNKPVTENEGTERRTVVYNRREVYIDIPGGVL